MTRPTPMTREELLELAALDAFGLLDEYEAALYTRSFHHAPVAVQSEIKELQSAFASEVSLLPDVEPDPALRRRVLDAVSRAIEAESLALAPLAMIGRPDRVRPGTAGRIGVGAATPVWRAAAFALAAALLVVAYFASQFLERNNLMTDAVLGLLTPDQVEEVIGPTYKEFVGNPNCITRALRPASGARNDAYAIVYVNEHTEEAFLFAVCLPQQAGPYTLTLTDQTTGDRPVNQQFKRTSSITGVQLAKAVPLKLATTLTWEIADATGTVLLRSATA